VNSDAEFARSETGAGALVAAFGDPETARQTAKRLRLEGFHKTWIGVTSDDDTLRSAEDSAGAKLGRFLSGKADGNTLIETLMKHGVPENEALRVDAAIQPSDVILTVDGRNHPELAAQIVEDFGGDILSGESFVYTTIDWTTTDDRLGSQILGYEDPNYYARGQRVDDEGFTRLRNERLRTGNVPTLSEDVFVYSFDDDDDDVDELDGESSGTRSAGGAIGTQHREDITP
jgi:hypothetical protein